MGGSSIIPVQDAMRENHMNVDRLAEQKLFEDQNSAEALLKDAIKESVEDGADGAVLIGEIIMGLFTGNKPKGLNAKEWKKVRRRSWLVIGGGLGAFIVPKVTPIITLILRDVVESRSAKRKLAQK